MIDPTMSLYSQSSPASWSIVFPAGVCSDRLESAAYLPSASASCVLILFNERSFAIHAVNAISPSNLRAHSYLTGHFCSSTIT